MGVEVISAKIVKARIEHRCDFCGGQINIGEEYHVTTCKYDHIYQWWSHLKCNEVFEALEMNDIDGVNGDQFMENVYEFLYENLPYSEWDVLEGEAAVDKALEIINQQKEV